MAYSDFTLDLVETQFGLTINDTGDYFAATPPATLSTHLRRQLERYTQLALRSGSEKARSELIIMPIMLEVFDQYPPGIGLFSGVDFSPDPQRSLRGICDYILTFAPDEPIIRAPVVTLAEAKREDLSTGLGQCVAEMVGGAGVQSGAKHRSSRNLRRGNDGNQLAVSAADWHNGLHGQDGILSQRGG